MRRYHRRAFVAACALAAGLVCAGVSGTAEAQYFLGYTGNALPNCIQNAVTIVSEAEQAIDTDHRVFGRWLLMAAQSIVEDASVSLPTAAFRDSMDNARSYCEKGKAKRALYTLQRAREEVQQLAAVWDVGGAEAKVAELCEITEKGDTKAALQGIDSLSASVRVDPVQKFLDIARTGLATAAEKNNKGYGLETAKALESAAHALREAYLASRLTQGKIFVAHARLMLGKGKRCRATWTLRRAERRLRRGGYMTDQATADALAKIIGDIESVCTALAGKGEGADTRCAEVEAKIVALLGTLYRPPAN